MPLQSAIRPCQGGNSISFLYTVSPTSLRSIPGRFTDDENSCFPRATLASSPAAPSWHRLALGYLEERASKALPSGNSASACLGTKCAAQKHSFPRPWFFFPAENGLRKVLEAGSLWEAAQLLLVPWPNPLPCRALLCHSAGGRGLGVLRGTRRPEARDKTIRHHFSEQLPASLSWALARERGLQSPCPQSWMPVHTPALPPGRIPGWTLGTSPDGFRFGWRSGGRLRPCKQDSLGTYLPVFKIFFHLNDFLSSSPNLSPCHLR